MKSADMERQLAIGQSAWKLASEDTDMLNLMHENDIMTTSDVQVIK